MCARLAHVRAVLRTFEGLEGAPASACACCSARPATGAAPRVARALCTASPPQPGPPRCPSGLPQSTKVCTQSLRTLLLLVRLAPIGTNNYHQSDVYMDSTTMALCFTFCRLFLGIPSFRKATYAGPACLTETGVLDCMIITHHRQTMHVLHLLVPVNCQALNQTVITRRCASSCSGRSCAA